ncbi:MAG: UDP-N-acetylmuramate dehydrogenase [Microbacteriaceae bacterium]|nr:UDP-N-acetylmuramate dehydrogenase [Microbacteriaceae bacterium]
MTRLADLTTIRVGGEPGKLLVADTKEELITFTKQVWEATDKWLILGCGSNVVASDELSDYQVVLVETKGVSIEGQLVTVQAGEIWGSFVDLANQNGWGGIESLAGIPGTVGASPIQNIGAYGQEVASCIVSVEFLDFELGEVIVLDNEFCEFGYRDSVFKRGRRGVVLSVTFKFEPGNPTELVARSEEVVALRKSKGMVLDKADHDTWSCGSFFMNPLVSESFARTLPLDAPQWEVGDQVKLSAAWLIEKAGLNKGFSLPGSKAAISTKHALAITNRGGATAQEVVELARFIQETVANRFGVTLVPEPNLVGF